MTKKNIFFAALLVSLFSTENFAACQAEANWSSICPGVAFPDGVKWGQEASPNGCYFYSSGSIQTATFIVNGTTYSNTTMMLGTTCQPWETCTSTPIDGGYYVYVGNEGWLNKTGTPAAKPACASAPAASINNASPKVDDVLTASITNASGITSYQWLANGSQVQSSSSNSYTVTASDVGKTITVAITHSGGTTTSGATAAVVKKNGPAAPAAPTASATTPNSITLTANAAYEFRLGSGGTWQSSNVFSGLSASTSYQFYQRVAETAGAFASNASPAATISTAAPANTDLQGEAVISNTNPVIDDVLTASFEGNNTNSSFTYQWYAGGASIVGATGNNYTVQIADAGKAIKVEIGGGGKDGSVVSDETALVQKKTNSNVPAALAIGDVAITYNSITINSPNPALQYGYRLASSVGEITWVPAGAITGLTYETQYNVYSRYKENSEYLQSEASLPLLVTTAEAPPTEYFITNNSWNNATARKGSSSGSVVTGANNVDYQTVINAIRADAAGSNVAITFGTGNGNQITVQMNQNPPIFENGGGQTWGKIILNGKLRLENPGTNNFITVGSGVSVESRLSITGMNPSDGYHLIGATGTGNITIVEAEILGGDNSSGDNKYRVVNSGTGTITVIGGRIDGTASIVNQSTGKIILGGNPEIGRIRFGAGTLELLTEGANAFAPVSKTYPLTFTGSPAAGNVVVTNGAAFHPNIFTLSNIGSFVMKPDLQTNLVLAANGTTALALSGTASIDNTSPRIGDVLTASFTGGTIHGVFKYQWIVGGVAAGTGKTYAVQPADFGKAITVAITTNWETGTVTSAATAAVQKKVGPSAPAAPTLVSKTYNSVTLTATAGYEYSSNCLDWQSSSVFLGLPSDTSFDFCQRIAATNDTEASATSGVLSVTTDELPAGMLNGIATISGNIRVGDVLTAVLENGNNTGALEYEWKADGSSVQKSGDNTYTIKLADVGKEIIVTITDTGDQTGSVSSYPTELVRKAVLTGTAVISGTTQVGNALTASLVGSNASGTLIYEWKSGGTVKAGVTGATYTLTESDVGKRITVAISTGDQEGALPSEPTSAVRDASGIAGVSYFFANTNDNGIRFELRKGSATSTVMATNEIDVLINTVRTDAGGADVIINFGTSNALNLNKTFEFSNGGGTWGEITLNGGLNLRDVSGPSIGSGVSVISNLSLNHGGWGNGYMPITNAGKLTVIGGTIVANGSSISITNTGTLILGGNPTISGGVTTVANAVSVITEGANAFAPVSKTYTLTFTGSPAVGNVVVANGAVFHPGIFTLSNIGSLVMKPDLQTNLVLAASGTTAPTLSGTASIDNTSPRIGDVLTASRSGGTIHGVFKYQWMVGGVAAGTGETYAVQVADFGKTITVAITTNWETGSITSAATAAVKKKVGPPAPAAPTLVSNTHDNVTLTATAGYEYSDGTTWQTNNVFTGLAPNTEHTFYQRIAATSDTEESVASEGLLVKTDKARLIGTATIAGYTGIPRIDDELTASLKDGNGTGALSYVWMAGEETIGTEETYTLTLNELGKTITVSISTENEIGIVTSEPTAAVQKKVGPPAPAAPTLASKTPNSITLEATVGNEYLIDGETWQLGNEFAGLKPNTSYTFYQRIAATSDTEASEKSAAVTEKTEKAQLDGTATIAGYADVPRVGDELTASLENGNGTEPLSYEWKADDNIIVGANASTYTLTASELGKTITVSISTENEIGIVTSESTVAVQKKVGPPAPAAPTLVSKTHNSVTLEATDGYEYSMGGITWQESNVFEGLSPNTPYTFYQRIAATPDTEKSVASEGLPVTTAKVPLEVTVTIDGYTDVPRVGDMLTVSLSRTVTGTLSYEWMAGEETIGTEETYTLTANEVGKTITVSISSDNEVGIATSAATAAVQKKINLAAPATPTVASNIPNSITLTPKAGYEYSKDGEPWQKSNVFEGLSPNTPYTFYQRVAETPDTEASVASEGLPVTTEKVHLSIIATINIAEPRVGDVLLASFSGNVTGTLNYVWKAGETTIGGNANTYTLTLSELGKTITVSISSDNEIGTATSEPTAEVQKKVGPAAPGVPTLADKTHNSITLTDGYEYSMDGATWQTNNEFAGLEPNTDYTFYQRIAETSDTEASDRSEPFTVKTKKAPLIGTATISGNIAEPRVGDKLTASFIGTATGTLSYVWEAGGNTIEAANASTYILTENEVGKTITVSISSDNEEGAAISAATAAVQHLELAGIATIAGYTDVPRMDDVLIASLKDDNNTGSLSYEWKADGETIGSGKTYTLTENEVGKTIAVIITSSKQTGLGIEGAVTAVVEYVVLNGTIEISGGYADVLRVGDVLTVLFSGNNTGTLSYEWKADGETIGSEETYTLTENEVGKTIAVIITSDKQTGFVESAATVQILKTLLTGIASIDNAAPRIGDVLTASFSGNNTSALSYVWKADDETIGDNASTYTVTLADLGKKIKVVISSAQEEGEVASDEVAAVLKKASTVVADVPAEPVVTHNSVTLVATEGYEYSKDGITWQASNVFSGLEPETSYTFYQRIAATIDTEASGASEGFLVTTEKEPSTLILPQIAGSNWIIQVCNGISLYAKAATVVEIFNANGAMISRQNYASGQHSISLAHLPKGMYVVRTTVGSEKKTLRIPIK